MDSAQEDAMAAENGRCSGEKILGEQIEILVPQRTRMRIADQLNPNSEEYCVQDITKESMVDTLVTEDGEEDESDDEVALPALKEQLRSVALTKRILFANGGASGAVLKALQNNQSSIRRQIVNGQRQSKIDMFSGKLLRFKILESYRMHARPYHNI